VVTPFLALFLNKDHTVAAAPPTPPRGPPRLGSIHHFRGRNPRVTWQRLSYPLSHGISWPRWPSPSSPGWQPWCAPSSTSRTPPRWRLSSNGSPRRWLGSCLRLLTTSSKPVVTCWPSGTSASELWRQIWSTNPQGARAQTEVEAQFQRVTEALAGKLPAAADHLEQARCDLLAFRHFR